MACSRSVLLVVLAVLASFFAGCSSDSADGPANGAGGASGDGAGGAKTGAGGVSGGSSLSGNCQIRCESFAQKCAEPISQCASVCSKITEVQLSCIEAADCDFGKTSACMQAGAGGSAGAGAGGSVGTGGNAGDGGCSIGDPPRCDAAGKAQIMCKAAGGESPVQVTETCSSGKCEKGQCTSSAKPDTLTVAGTLDQWSDEVTSQLSDDQTQLISLLSGQASHVSYSPDPNDQLDLDEAASASIEDPPTSGCEDLPRIGLGLGNATFMFTGVDVLPSTSCSAFAKAMQENGISVTYHDVPYLNGGSAHTVTVKLAP